MIESNNHPNDIDVNSVQGHDQLDTYWDQQQFLNNHHGNYLHERGDTPEQEEDDYDDGFRDNDVLGNERNNVDEDADFEQDNNANSVQQQQEEGANNFDDISSSGSEDEKEGSDDNDLNNRESEETSAKINKKIHISPESLIDHGNLVVVLGTPGKKLEMPIQFPFRQQDEKKKDRIVEQTANTAKTQVLHSQTITEQKSQLTSPKAQNQQQQHQQHQHQHPPTKNLDSPSKMLIPPPNSIPFRQQQALPSSYEEDADKIKFMRFLKMVERKKEATTAKQISGLSNSAGGNKSPSKRNEDDEGCGRYNKSGNKSGDEDQFEERDMLWSEGLYELHRKRKVNQRLVRGYCQLLDIDYNQNRMVVCGYQAHILKTVGSMIQKKPNDKANKKNLSQNRRSQDRFQLLNSKTSPIKPQAIQSQLSQISRDTKDGGPNVVQTDPHEAINQMIQSCQNPRLFFIFDKDNADKMFGYRVRYLGPEDDENEDQCFAYRHVPQKPVITQAKPLQQQLETITSPKLNIELNASQSLSPRNQNKKTFGTNASNNNKQAPIQSTKRAYAPIKQYVASEMIPVTKRYLQLKSYVTSKLIKLPKASEDEIAVANQLEELGGEASPGNETNASPSKKKNAHRRINLCWFYSEPMIDDSSNSPSKNQRKQINSNNWRQAQGVNGENQLRQSQGMQWLKSHKQSQVNLQKIAVVEAERLKHANSVTSGGSNAQTNMGGQILNPQQFNFNQSGNNPQSQFLSQQQQYHQMQTEQIKAMFHQMQIQRSGGMNQPNAFALNSNLLNSLQQAQQQYPQFKLSQNNIFSSMSNQNPQQYANQSMNSNISVKDQEEIQNRYVNFFPRITGTSAASSFVSQQSSSTGVQSAPNTSSKLGYYVPQQGFNELNNQEMQLEEQSVNQFNSKSNQSGKSNVMIVMNNQTQMPQSTMGTLIPHIQNSSNQDNPQSMQGKQTALNSVGINKHLSIHSNRIEMTAIDAMKMAAKYASQPNQKVSIGGVGPAQNFSVSTLDSQSNNTYLRKYDGSNMVDRKNNYLQSSKSVKRMPMPTSVNSVIAVTQMHPPTGIVGSNISGGPILPKNNDYISQEGYQHRVGGSNIINNAHVVGNSSFFVMDESESKIRHPSATGNNQNQKILKLINNEMYSGKGALRKVDDRIGVANNSTQNNNGNGGSQNRYHQQTSLNANMGGGLNTHFIFQNQAQQQIQRLQQQISANSNNLGELFPTFQQNDRYSLNGAIDNAIRSHHQSQTTANHQLNTHTQRNSSKQQTSTMGNVIGTKQSEKDDPFFGLDLKKPPSTGASTMVMPIGSGSLPHNMIQTTPFQIPPFNQHSPFLNGGKPNNEGGAGTSKSYGRPNVAHNGALGAPRRYEQPGIIGIGQGNSGTSEAANSNIFQTKSQSVSGSAYNSMHVTLQPPGPSQQINSNVIVLQNVKTTLPAASSLFQPANNNSSNPSQDPVQGSRLFFNEQRSLVRRGAANPVASKQMPAAANNANATATQGK